MSKNNVWLSVSDLMTGLMIIFLFIAIAYISRVQKEQSVLTDYIDTKDKLHSKLVNEFAGDTLLWKMSIGKDLSLKFKDPTILFPLGAENLTPKFKEILDDFIPRYINILLNDSLRHKIHEIRIEGHTDTVPIPSKDRNSYIGNTMLSQQRALNTLKYIYKNHIDGRYIDYELKLLQYWFTATGHSFGKALDSDGSYATISNNAINADASRRVEFRIITSGDEILENFVNQTIK